MEHFYSRIVSLITKPSQLRSDDEVLSLVPWFSKKSRLFEAVPQEVLVDILRNCDHATFGQDQLIIRQNDRGDTFYIILSGRVSIFVNTDSVPDDPAEARLSESTFAQPLDRKKLGNFIVQFDAGKTFGELALMTKDCVRNATVVADEPTDLIVINRTLFDRSIRATHEYDLRVREAFVKEHPLFRGWAPRYRRQAMMSLRREQLQFGMMIVKQGDPVNGLIMIKSGQAKVIVDTIQHDKQYDKFANSASARPSSRLFNNGILTSRQSYSKAEIRLQKRNVELCIIGENEVIGDVEQTADLPTYMQTITCIQPCELMILDEKNFERLITKRNLHSNKLLQQNAEAKLRFRDDGSVPLIREIIQYLERQKNMRRLRDAGADCRDPFEIVRQPVSYSMKELHNVLNFLPPRGALVDLYGPGTLFYRNRSLRKMKEVQEGRVQARLNARSEGPTINLFRPQASSMQLPEQHSASEVSYNNSSAKHDGRHGNQCVICATINRRLKSSNSAASSSRASTARSFKDWETSNEHLCELEDRMQDWLVFLGERNHSKQRFFTQVQTPNVTQLRNEPPVRVNSSLPIRLQRFRPPNRHFVQPGIKVVFRRRSGDAAAQQSYRDDNLSKSVLLVRPKTEPLSIRTTQSALTDFTARWNSAKSASSPQLDGNSDSESLTSSSRSGSRSREKKRGKNKKKKKTVSVNEYNALKSRMKRQEVELANFRARADILF